MRVILNEDVPNLGEEGDICNVADGYGRNYLIPKNLAVPENKANLKMFESRRETIEKRKEEKRNAAKSLKERLEAEPFIIQRPSGDTGKLFGGVTNAAVAEELEKNGIPIERKRIELPEHTLKMTGTYNVKIKLYDKETAAVKLVIQGLNKDGEVIEQKEIQAKRQEAAEAAEAAEAEEQAEEAVAAAEESGDEPAAADEQPEQAQEEPAAEAAAADAEKTE